MLALSKKIDIVFRLREAPGLDAALLHEVTCSHRPADHVTARWDGFAVRSLDLVLTACDAKRVCPLTTSNKVCIKGLSLNDTKKRRPKNYHLLTKPRHEMKISGHRNRPKSPLS